jgi:putative copper export protein
VDKVLIVVPYVHLLAAMYWTGASIFLALVATPLLNRVRPPSFQRLISRSLWQGAHRTMWVAVALVFVTGLLQMQAKGLLSPSLLSVDTLRTPFGQKLAAVVLMVVLSLLHDLWLGHGARLRDPAASTDPPGIIGRATPWIVAVGTVAATVLALMARAKP